jgi:Flp pilus assembly pilin Flp
MALLGLNIRTRTRLGSEEAQTMAEYAVILAVITPAIVASIALLASAILPLITQVIGFLS